MMSVIPLLLSLICCYLALVNGQYAPVEFSIADLSKEATGKCGKYLECPGLRGRSTCCPFTDGKCCGNNLFLPMKGFCCPKGYECQRQGQCVKSGQPQKKRDYLVFSPQRKPDSPSVTYVQCPDGMSRCPNENTCCLLKSGKYGCCPYPRAVCCNDREHCCPENTYCDESSSSCVRSASARNKLVFFHSKPQPKIPARPLGQTKVGYIVCPDGASECDDGQTCCLLSDGNYGCCPYPQAVCCDDGAHCCPHGTQCDTETARCITRDSLAAFLSNARKSFKKTLQVPEALSAKVKLDSAVVDAPQAGKLKYRRCGVEGSICNDWETCCRYPDKSWGCCPVSQGSCCPNGLSCCPHGYICDNTSTRCLPVSRAYSHRPMPFVIPLKKAPAFTIPKSVICADGVSVCPDQYTCCLLSDATWGCCPLPHAVCCNDHIHCCPSGYVCDMSSGSCNKAGNLTHRVPMSRKLTAEKAVASMRHPVFEPRPTISPPSAVSKECQIRGLLTCATDDNQHRCCPFKMGSCCAGGQMCCPLGYSCSAGSFCIRNP